MGISRTRVRNQPILIGTETVNGGRVAFKLDHGRRLAFATVPGDSVLAFGLHVSVSGTVKLAPGFDIHGVDVSILPPPGSGYGTPRPFEEGDRDTALTNAVTGILYRAVERLLAREASAVAEAWMTLADDYVLGRMDYRKHIVDKQAGLGEGASWSEEQFCRDQIEAAEREAASLDTEAYSEARMHSTRPGYVVVCDGKLVDRGDERHREDRGRGWVQRHVFIHLASAHRFARDLSGDDIRVERIRIVEGVPFVVSPEGLSDPEWSLSDPVLTGTLMAPG